MEKRETERKALAEALRNLSENLTTMADLSQIAIRKAVESLVNLDVAQAQEVYTLDNEIYALQQVVEQQSVELIALHAPVARDLRTVSTSLKITTDIDRIGRYAMDIAEIAEQIAAQNGKHFKKELSTLTQMAEVTIDMVDKAVQAFVDRDAASMENIMREDDTVDSLHDTSFREIVTYMMDRSVSIHDGAQYILVSRYLERIADHAVNIGNRVVYMVTGKRPGPKDRRPT